MTRPASSEGSLADGQVMVRWMVLDGLAGSDWPDLALRLTEGERLRAMALRHAADRQAYIAAHALLRTLICQLAGGQPAEWCILPEAGGKPRIVVKVGPAPLRFSLSHTHGLVAVAMTRRTEVGVDVERLRADALDPADADAFFSPREIAALLACPPQDRLAHAFAVWTLKEAFLKSLGLGLHDSCPLDAFDIRCDPPGVTRAPAHAGDPARWVLHSAWPTERHVLAVALRHESDVPLQIDARPMGLEAFREGRPSFLKKRSKRLSNACADLSGQVGSSEWKFFGSFFQKRTSWLSQTRHAAIIFP
jgi:4'-phosphopantetheinyl transferase